MSKKVISVKLNSKSINKAIKEIEKYKRELLEKEQKLLEGLASIGVSEASIRFTTAMYDGVNDVTVTLDKSGKGYVIKAEGEAVAFIVEMLSLILSSNAFSGASVINVTP